MIDTYIYKNHLGQLYLKVEKRSPPPGKTRSQYPQFHWTGADWAIGKPAGPKIPYRLPELLAAQAKAPTPVHIPEGEKDANTLAVLGLVATTCSEGAKPGSWTGELNKWFEGVRQVFIPEDNDDPGRAFAQAKARALSGIVLDVRIVSFPDVPVGEDVSYWISEQGHSLQEYLARCEAAPRWVEELDEWDAGEALSEGPPEPRGWLLGRYFCREYLSGLVARGDTGKTTLRLTQAIELAIGRELLGARIHQRCPVLVVCLEDNSKELKRRLLAICKHHNINPRELKGWLFCRNLNGPKLAEIDKGKRLVGKLDGMLRRAIARTRCGLVILDPFVKVHALEENDNPAMDFVCSLLIKIAEECNVAIDSPAHTHKGTIEAGDADARRGATAQRDAGRLDYTLTTMSEDEAKQFGVPEHERKSYVRLDKAKANMVRAMKATWLRLVNVPLVPRHRHHPSSDLL